MVAGANVAACVLRDISVACSRLEAITNVNLDKGRVRKCTVPLCVVMLRTSDSHQLSAEVNVQPRRHPPSA